MQISAFLGSRALRDYSSGQFNLFLAAVGRPLVLWKFFWAVCLILISFALLFSRRKSVIVLYILNSKSNIRNSWGCVLFSYDLVCSVKIFLVTWSEKNSWWAKKSRALGKTSSSCSTLEQIWKCCFLKIKGLPGQWATKHIDRTAPTLPMADNLWERGQNGPQWKELALVAFEI